uniref:Uncharacterized protein n=1 Tax=Panagrolaimus superbus TaxID=310955 RepID=A0A914YYT9_9BILA
MINDIFLASSKPSVAIPDQQSFKSVIIHKSSNIPPVIGDDFLDQIHETKPCAKQPAPVVGDDFLDQIQTSNFAQRRAPIVEDDFLNQIGRSNDIVTVKNGNSSSMPFGSSSSKPSFAVPGQQPFKPVIIHKSSNLPFFEDDTLAKLINSAEIGVNYDSDGSESTAPETSNRNFTPLEYKIDHYLNVPNFIVVNKMKKEIAQSMPKYVFCIFYF